jgi:hypothetical protein
MVHIIILADEEFKNQLRRHITVVQQKEEKGKDGDSDVVYT